MVYYRGSMKMNSFEDEKNICTHYMDDYGRFDGAVVPPIYENSLFVFKTFRDLCNGLENEADNYVYTRGINPTVEILEKKLAALEHGEKCKCFSSGMGAISSVISSFVKQGDHILFVNSVYGPAIKFAGYLKKFGISYSISAPSIDSVKSSIRSNTSLIYMESPGTMTFRLVDIPAVVKLARENGIKTAIDNTWSTPLFQKPLDMGVDVSIHSCTKYISGHSDVVAGAVITSKEIYDRIYENEFMSYGASIGPFEAWLIMRGLRTLPVRMEKHQESAIKVAGFLEKHRNVVKVNYPGLESSPDYELGRKLMTGYSGLMSFEIKSDMFEDVEKVLNSLKLFKLGVSWGGFESLALSPNHGNNIEELIRKGESPSLIRISIGLEAVDDLIADLDNALNLI
jgi:cystathionine beta-lyase